MSFGDEGFEHILIVNHIDQVDWRAAARAIATIPHPDPDGGYDPLSSHVASWHEDLTIDLFAGANPETVALLRAADPEQMDTVRAVLLADLDRLRGWLTTTDQDPDFGGPGTDGAIRQVGPGVLFSANADLRYFEAPLDCPWHTIKRLADAGCMELIPGLSYTVE